MDTTPDLTSLHEWNQLAEILSVSDVLILLNNRHRQAIEAIKTELNDRLTQQHSDLLATIVKLRNEAAFERITKVNQP